MTSWRSDAAPDRVPNAVDPEDDESLPGWLKRMGEVNAFPNPMQMLRPLNPDFRTLIEAVSKAPNHEGLAEFLTLTPQELDRMCYGGGPIRRLLGHKLHADLVAVGRRKLCPLCLEENPYHRATWDMTIATVCPRHAVRLVDRCTGPGCDLPLDWRPGPLARCTNLACGADLREEKAEPVPEAEMGGARALDRLLRSGACPEFGATVGALPVGEQVLLVFHLGCLALGHDRVTRPAHFARSHAPEVHRVLDAGWRTCLDWPHGFHALLDARRSHGTGRRGRYGMRKSFGHVYGWIERRGDAPFASLLREALHSYVLERPDLATRAPEIQKARSSESLSNQFVTINDAADLLGVASKKARSLAAERGLYLIEPTGKGAPALIRADLLYDLRAERDRLLTKADVKRFLGTGKRAVEKLCEAGFLTALPSADDPEVACFLRDEVEALLRNLEAVVPPGSAKPKHTVDPVGVARAVSRPVFDVCDVLATVQRGLLTPVAVDARRRGLARIRFRHSDVEAFAASLNRPPDRTLCITEAAKELGIHPDAAYAWAARGILETVQVGGPKEKGQRVTEDALRRFRERYVTGTELAARLKLCRSWVGRHLQERGIEPVSGRTVDGVRQFLFRRADMKEIRRADLLSGVSRVRRAATADKRLDRRRAEGLRNMLGGAIARELGLRLQRHWGRYVGTDGTVVQAMVAGNMGVSGRYQFLLREDHYGALAAAQRAYVAFAFADRGDFLLAPWSEVVPLLSEPRARDSENRRIWRFEIRAGADGHLSPLGGHARFLREMEPPRRRKPPPTQPAATSPV